MLLAVALPAIALLTLFSAIVWLRVRADRTADLDASLQVRATALGALVERDHGVWEIDPTAAGLVGGAVAWEVRVDPDGSVLGSAGPTLDIGPGAHTVRLPDSRRVRAWTGTLDVTSDDAPDDEEEEPAPPAEPLGPARVRILVADDTAPLARDLQSLLGLLAGVGTVLAAAAVGVGAWLSRRIVDPIEHQRLHDAWVRQARFTADASHELRTPLAVIRSQAEVALRRERTPEAYREALVGVVEGAARMNGTLEGLLLLARSDAGEPLSTERVDLADLARAAVAGLPEGVGVEAPTAVWVRGDARLLDTLLRNLLSNAVRHTPGGTVVVRVAREGTRAVLEVRDQGEGIAPDALPHVFERFGRADAARARDSGGAGLGLSIVRSVAERHGGTVAIRSRLGEGTVVTVAIPGVDG